MSRYQKELVQKAKKKVRKQGFKEVGHQHNGILFVHLDNEDMLHRKIVTITGRIMTYITRKATLVDKVLYELT